MTEILKTSTLHDIEAVVQLADEIWTEHYLPIIGSAQIQYMLEKFQSAAAIAEQISRGYEYYIVNAEGRNAGYFALAFNTGEAAAQLSKIYVKQHQRGSGIGRAILKFSEKRCIEKGIRLLYLTVNRNNIKSVTFYQKMGFVISGEVVMDIGGGFVMDDYRMTKRLEPA